MSQEFVARKGLISLKDIAVNENLVVSQGITGATVNANNLTDDKLVISQSNRLVSSSYDIDTITQLSVSSNDTTNGFLEDKLINGPGIIRSVVNEGADEQLQFKLGPHYLSLASSGLYEGALLSVGGTQGTIDISAGNGLYIDSTTDFGDIQVGGVVITPKTNFPITNIAIQPVTYIGIDKNDNVIEWSSFPTPQQRRDNIFLGVAVHSNNVDVQFVNNTPSVALDITGQLQDLMIGLGFFNLSGNIISPNGNSLNIQKSFGKAFKAGSNFSVNAKDPHTLTLNTLLPASFRYRNQDSSEGLDITTIDPTTWDNGGTTEVIGGSQNRATIQRVFIFPSNQIRIQRGQHVYSNMSDAINAVGKESTVTETNLAENGLLLCSIAVTKGATDLSDPSDAQFFTATRFGELGSVGSSSTGTLQDAYVNSIEPELLVDDIRQALSIRNGTSLDSNNLLEVQNISGDNVFEVNGLGEINTNSITMTNHLKVGDVTVTKEDGMMWYSNNQITFRENGVDRNLGSTLNKVEDINDVTLNSIQDNQVLAYNTAISGWENVDVASIAISGADSFVSKSGDTITYLDSEEHLKVGVINIGTTKTNGHIWYDNGFQFYENGQQKTFETIIDDHIMKALEKQIKVNSTNSSITYIGEAEPGSATVDPVWRVKEVVESGDDIVIQWADGNGNFDNIFDDRETLSYT